MSEKKLLRKRIEAAKQLNDVMRDYFYRMDRISKGEQEGKIAWCTSVGPAELLSAFGFQIHYPENHGAMLGSTRLAMDYIPVANSIGYSPEICSYLTSDVGSYLKGETPLSRHRQRAQARRAGLQHQSVPRCQGVAGVLCKGVRRAGGRYQPSARHGGGLA